MLFPETDVEFVSVVHWCNCTQIRFSDADILVHELNGDVIVKVPPVELDCGKAVVVEHHDNWDLVDIP